MARFAALALVDHVMEKHMFDGAFADEAVDGTLVLAGAHELPHQVTTVFPATTVHYQLQCITHTMVSCLNAQVFSV